MRLSLDQPVRVSVSELQRRVARVRELLACCGMCALRCKADRAQARPAPCGLGVETRLMREYLSVTEEPEIIPALRVYLAGCNFRCAFCDTAPDCVETAGGDRIEPRSYAMHLRAELRHGARSISVLGGEPTLHVHTLLEMALAAPQLPLAVNTNLYMSAETIELLDGVVAAYIGDFKFGQDECARRLAGILDYVGIARENIQRIAARGPLIVRHLLMPGHYHCCFRPVAEWLAAAVPGTRFQLYTGFVPCWRAGQVGVGRLNTAAEARAAVATLRKLNLDWRAAAHDG